MMKLHLTLLAIVLVIPMTADAQGLADVARAEEARRKTVTKPSKVYTNVDLQPDITATPAPSPTPAEPVPGDQAASQKAPAGKVEPAPALRDQAYWSGRINTARQALERSRMFAEALQSRINALTTDFTNRDDPAQRAQIELERQRAVAELDRVKKEMTEQTKAIADIAEEGRKAGVPPGWLR